MEFSELIRARYSVRSYSNRGVPEDVLQRVLDAFVLAPTAANKQPFGLVVAHRQGKEDDLRRVYRPGWLAEQPPLIVCACTIPDAAWTRSDGKNYADVDLAIAMDHLILAAANEGLGTCWIGAFDPDAAKEIFGLPEGVEPVAMTPLGYPADATRPKLRKSRDELVHHETW